MSRITPRVAIVGSCITRDLWPIHGGGAEALLYISRTGLPSLLGRAVRGFHPVSDLPGDLHRHEHNAVVADVQKTALSRLVAFAPTHVIFDFIDERFDLLSAGGGLVTESYELVRSGYLGTPAFQGARRVPRLSAACDRLWAEAVGEFAALVRATRLSEARLILHAARWAADQRLADGSVVPIEGVQILPGLPARVSDYNDVLARQEAAFEAVMPPLARVEAAAAHQLADPAHRWGLSPFHYVPEYYVDIRRQLDALGLAEAFSDPLAAPSAPAA